MAHYELGGRDGVWQIVSGYVADDNIVMIFQNIGSGEYVEVEICPFNWIINKNIDFRKWQN
jgi:hypothetical protein